MTLSLGELSHQLPTVALRVAGEVPVIGALFKVCEILGGMTEGVLQERRLQQIESRILECEEAFRLWSPDARFKSQDVLQSDAMIDLIREAQQIVLNSSSKSKRLTAARILFYSTLLECELEFDLATRMLKDLEELEDFHLVILKCYASQDRAEISVEEMPAALRDVMPLVVFHKGISDLVKLGFIVLFDGRRTGQRKTEYLNTFVNHILQDIQS